MSPPKVFCVTGIDTDIGKTIATGLLASSFRKNGCNAITQKVVQTGCTGISEDIVRHRQLMEIGLLSVDLRGLTCPYVFPVACSPHLAARLANEEIDCEKIRRSTAELLKEFDLVFLEGAGGLMVPLNSDYTFLDYVASEKYPLILVTSCRLGSINHTLSALELASYRKLDVAAIIYNSIEATDERIVSDSREIFAISMKKHGYQGPVIDLLPLESYEHQGNLPDFYQYLIPQGHKFRKSGQAAQQSFKEQ